MTHSADEQLSHKVIIKVLIAHLTYLRDFKLYLFLEQYLDVLLSENVQASLSSKHITKHINFRSVSALQALWELTWSQKTRLGCSMSQSCMCSTLKICKY